jgi:hypothetical protein
MNKETSRRIVNALERIADSLEALARKREIR